MLALYRWRDFVKPILVEHHEDVMSLESYTKLVNADTQSEDWFILESALDGGASLSLQAPTVQVVLSGI
ncbi:hypothetical protein ARMSODRAFT_1024750 [Armillaria solidipes]|uniref:Uncharacterized protein n=1 Tax=Armillaria solidipes TaxID=1076256 RepID=A0A2H3AYE9_9AGAR|nr:hypothetical protein ARMSODRAFT_1024750 [Armillaria solidipes]